MTETEKDRELLREYADIPYTLVGHTSLLSSFHVTLTAEGLKKILSKAHDGDLVSVTVHDKNWTDFEVVHMKRSHACNHTNPTKAER